MGILVALALLSVIFFGVTVVMQTAVGALGGAVPARGPLRAVALIGQARLASLEIDREYRELLRG